MAVYMSPKTSTTQKWTLDSVALQDAYTDFILSRQAALCSQNTMLFYRFTAGKFVQWLEAHGISSPDEVQARHVREYLAELAGRGKSDGTIADHARGIRVIVRFWYAENYLPAPLLIQIPKVGKKRLLSLDADNLNQVINSCDSIRDKAIIMLMADSGIRRSELCNLNWSDIDMQSGLLRVKQGKGKKDRSAVVGATTRRQLLKYRRTLDNHSDVAPMFQARGGGRFTGQGLRQVFQNISEKTGIKVTAHSMRRTFAILSLRAGMSPLHLQALGGWEGLEMVKHYAQMVGDDLLQAHQQHSPIDNLSPFQ
jgi:site-specific recombinase XerD